MRQCVNCLSVTSYFCLSCTKAACNKSHNCSVPASEDVLGWKTGVSVSYCRLCYSSSKNDKVYNIVPEIAPQHVNVNRPTKHQRFRKGATTKSLARLTICYGNGMLEQESQTYQLMAQMLMEEARLIADRLGEKSFQGTEGWLTKWKQRHNIKQMNIAGEEGDVNQETLESWQ